MKNQILNSIKNFKINTKINNRALNIFSNNLCNFNTSKIINNLDSKVFKSFHISNKTKKFDSKLKNFNNNMNKNFSSIFIKTSETPNPQFVKFMPGKEVMEDNETFDIANKNEALCSPLAVKLFDIKGITRVFYGPDYISIGKEELIDWSDLKPLIIDEIVRHYTANDDLFLIKPVSDDTEIKEGDSEAIQLIKEIIAARIRPVVQEDGGDIKYISFDEIDGVVYLQMMGSCKGCPSSGVTLKNGIEKMLIHYVAEVQSVEEYDEDEIDEF